MPNSRNKLYVGDNLQALRTIPLNSIDLVYIDPPFASGTDFYISDDRSNTISHSLDAKLAYSDKFTLASYLEYMKPRLQLIHDVLSSKGSLYLHIDSGRVHYLKIMLDEIFGIENFRADITRIKCNPKNFKRKNYGNIKDHILFYTKSDAYIWNEAQEDVNEEELAQRFKKQDDGGRFYTTVPLHAPGETKNGATGGLFLGQSPPIGRHWRYHPDKLLEYYNQGLIETSKTGNMRLKVFREDGQSKKVQDVWSFKDPQNPQYPTQKNSDLLDRIILTSSHPDSTVLDCFCGSGTTILAARKFSRRWIGMDQSPEAIKIITKRLKEDSAELWQADYELIKIEETVECLDF